MLLYPLAYAVVWSLPTSIRIYQTISGHPAPWQLATVDKACIVLQGFVDAIIYGATESSLSTWRTALFPESRKRLSGVVVACDVPRPSDHNSLWKRRSRNWDSTSIASAGQQELVSRSSLTTTSPGMAGTPSNSQSVESLEMMTTTGPTPKNSAEKVELERVARRDEHGPKKKKMGIRKTVQIEVVNSAAAGGNMEAAPRRPEKTHFPNSQHGSYLDL